jgi:O-antigen/teichoic acid export membrane protein
VAEIVNQCLQRIAKGAVVIFIGMICGTLLSAIGNIILVRYITQSEYGIYSLSLVVIAIICTISTLGLGEGSARYIAYFRAKNEVDNVRAVVSLSVTIALISSILFAVISYISSDFISISILNKPILSNILKSFSISIPFFVLINVIIAIFRGFGDIKANIYFQYIYRNIFFIASLLIVVSFKWPFIGVVFAYVLSIALTCFVSILYLLKNYHLSMRQGENVNSNSLLRDLLYFSIPLLAVTMLISILSWTDTLMLGYFKSPDVVGLYSAAQPLASLVPLVLYALGFLYTPLLCDLYARNKFEELEKSYAISTKWCFISSLPIFYLLFLFPEHILKLLYGANYAAAASALQIIVMGRFVNIITGPNYNTLIALGKSKSIMTNFLISGSTSIILNIILIPELGLVGAAISSGSALALSSILLSINLYQYLGIHPISRSYLKVVIISFAMISLNYAIIVKGNLVITNWTMIISVISFLIVYCFLLLLTKCFEEEDLMLALAIEKKSGLDLTAIKKIIEPFIFK